jgi:hypothetical protein
LTSDFVCSAHQLEASKRTTRGHSVANMGIADMGIADMGIADMGIADMA